MYFQYDTNGIPLGFIYNGIQYFYITNQMGDIIAITDATGVIVGNYVYDAWGSLLAIITANENNAEQLAVVNANPLRYRGYYYDAETGYYYLQSRYYDPELGRFISADSFGYINNYLPCNINSYAYCRNNPISYIDSTGTEAGWVSDAGIAVAEFISIIFLCLEALSTKFVAWSEEVSQKASEDFATIIAAMVINDRSILYPSANGSQGRHDIITKWLTNSAETFAEFIKTSFYK